jgi:nucleotide-binding universal stress UspA family protein
MKVVAWITETGWEACVDAAKAYPASEFTLIHVADVELPGPRGRRHDEVMARMSALADDAARALLDDAEERLTGGLKTAADRVAAATRGEPFVKVRKVAAGGHAESALMDAIADADVLVLTREGGDVGPHSIGHATRYVLDHAPCTVVLAWP